MPAFAELHGPVVSIRGSIRAALQIGPATTHNGVYLVSYRDGLRTVVTGCGRTEQSCIASATYDFYTRCFENPQINKIIGVSDDIEREPLPPLSGHGEIKNIVTQSRIIFAENIRGWIVAHYVEFGDGFWGFGIGAAESERGAAEAAEAELVSRGTEILVAAAFGA